MSNTLKLSGWLWPMFFLCGACGSERRHPIVDLNALTTSSHHVDTSAYVILQFDAKRDYFFQKPEDFRAATLCAAEVDEMEPLVDSAYRQLAKELPTNYQSLQPLSMYKRQYVAVINRKGQKEVWVNFFCEAPEYWRRGTVDVVDGGACYLQLYINLTLRTASKLYDNAVA
jgi:hypothetical protein